MGINQQINLGGEFAPVLRYPGGKQRLLRFLRQFLPSNHSIKNRYFEPFFGGGAVFLSLRPEKAVLTDINSDLIDVYLGIKDDPVRVWNVYRSFDSDKQEYNRVRDLQTANLCLTERAARLLYLNRTCFKGFWRHNSKGQFNVGYGGQSRRWVVTKDYLVDVSSVLDTADIWCSDFEDVLKMCKQGDFVFLDPPYKPAYKELGHDHYGAKRFTFADHERLARVLHECTQRGVRWLMTTSAHPDILALFQEYFIREIPSAQRLAGCGRMGC